MQVSASSDFELPKEHQVNMTGSSPAEYRINDTIETNGTSATTYVLSHYNTIDWIVIKNLDTTNFCEVVFRTGANSTTDNKIDIAAEKFIVLTDVTAAQNLTLTADTAAVLLDISYSGT
jgi:hypothetical protein